MSQRYSSRYGSGKPRDNRPKHVRRRQEPSQLPSWMIIVAGVVALVAIGFLVRVVINAISDDDVTERAQSNRLWLDESWTNTPVSNAQMATLVQRLNEHRIEMVYVETGAWREDDIYRAWKSPADFRQQLQDVAPNVKALVWIWYEPARHANNTSQQSIFDYIETAIDQWGYDGVQIQGYTVLNESPGYLSFVQELHEALPGNSILSITAPPDHSPTDTDVPRGLGNPGLSWGPRYKRNIAAQVDEMVVMAHAAGLEDIEDYERWVAYQIETYARDIDESDNSTDIIVAFPTYPSELFHDPAVENVTSAANGTRDGMQRAGNASRHVIGAGLYIFDTSSDADWADFKGFWLD